MKLFTYGSLINDDIRLGVLGYELAGKYSVLYDYDLKQHNNCQFLTIYSKIGGMVKGMILDVTELDMARLDRYENNLYNKIKVNVEGIPCFTYIEKQIIMACNLCKQEFKFDDIDYYNRIARHYTFHFKARIQHRNMTQGKPNFIRI